MSGLIKMPHEYPNCEAKESTKDDLEKIFGFRKTSPKTITNQS